MLHFVIIAHPYQKPIWIIICQCKAYAKGVIEEMAKQKSGIVARSEPTSGHRSGLKVKWWHSSLQFTTLKIIFAEVSPLDQRTKHVYKH